MDARLKVNGQEVPIGQSRINLKKTNPLFVRDGLPSIRSLPFQLPALDEIRKIFGFPENVHNLELPVSLPSELYIRESLFQQGPIEVREATHRMIESHLLDGLGEFAEAYGNKSIRELDLGTAVICTTVAKITFEILAAGDPTPFTIMLNGNDYFENISGSDTPADITNALANAINADFPGYATVIGGNDEFIQVAQPTPEDEWELGWLPQTGGSTRVAIANQTTIIQARQPDYKAWFEDVCKDNPANYDYCMPTMWAPYFYEQENPGVPGVVSDWNEGWSNYYFEEAWVNSVRSNESWTHSCLPCVKLRPILEAMFSAAGYTLEVDADFDTSRDFSIAYMLNLYAIDQSFRVWDEAQEDWEGHVNVFKPSFVLNTCLPDMTFTSFLKGVVITFMAQFDWYGDENRVVLRAADRVFETAEEDNWEGLVVGRPHLKYLYNKGYTLSHAIDDEDPIYDFYRADPAALNNLPNYLHEVNPYVYGPGEEKIENPFGIQVNIPTFDTPPGEVDFVNYWVPFIFRKGYSDYFGLGYGNWTPRIGFFRGFTEGTTDDYPGGRSDNRDNVNQVIAGAYSLAWGGDYGLVETRWKNFLYFMANTRPIEIYIDPAKTTMAHLNEDTPKRALGTRWILADYTLDLPARGPQKVTLYRF